MVIPLLHLWSNSSDGQWQWMTSFKQEKESISNSSPDDGTNAEGDQRRKCQVWSGIPFPFAGSLETFPIDPMWSGNGSIVPWTGRWTTNEGKVVLVEIFVCGMEKKEMDGEISTFVSQLLGGGYELVLNTLMTNDGQGSNAGWVDDSPHLTFEVCSISMKRWLRWKLSFLMRTKQSQMNDTKRERERIQLNRNEINRRFLDKWRQRKKRNSWRINNDSGRTNHQRIEGFSPSEKLIRHPLVGWWSVSVEQIE